MRYQITDDMEKELRDMGWRFIGKELPRKDSTFLMAWDGSWVIASRGNKDFVTFAYIDDVNIIHIKDLIRVLWFDIPDYRKIIYRRD